MQVKITSPAGLRVYIHSNCQRMNTPTVNDFRILEERAKLLQYCKISRRYSESALIEPEIQLILQARLILQACELK